MNPLRIPIGLGFFLPSLLYDNPLSKLLECILHIYETTDLNRNVCFPLLYMNTFSWTGIGILFLALLWKYEVIFPPQKKFHSVIPVKQSSPLEVFCKHVQILQGARLCVLCSPIANDSVFSHQMQRVWSMGITRLVLPNPPQLLESKSSLSTALLLAPLNGTSRRSWTR